MMQDNYFGQWDTATQVKNMYTMQQEAEQQKELYSEKLAYKRANKLSKWYTSYVYDDNNKPVCVTWRIVRLCGIRYVKGYCRLESFVMLYTDWRDNYLNYTV